MTFKTREQLGRSCLYSQKEIFDFIVISKDKSLNVINRALQQEKQVLGQLQGPWIPWQLETLAFLLEEKMCMSLQVSLVLIAAAPVGV